MQVVDPGHRFALDMLDCSPHSSYRTTGLTYVKREGTNYPGNIGHYAGTTLQEVCRAQISRALYVDNQISCIQTRNFIRLQRESILELELRAAERHGRVLLNVREDIENEPTCLNCGHIQCNSNCR
jgi:hypothetical protein